MKYTLTLIFACSIFLKLKAQEIAEIPRLKFFTTSIGATWQTRYDDIITPLTHSGIGAELHTGAERISEKWYKKFDLWGGYNALESRVDKGYNTTAHGIRYGISQIWAKRVFKNAPKFHTYIGGQLFHESSMAIHFGNVNNIFSYNAPTGIAAAAYMKRDVRFFKRQWIVSSQLTLPLLAYNARPSYIGFVSEDNLLKDFGIVTLNKLVNIDWRWQLDLPLPNSNRLRLSYRWSFLNDTHSGHLQMGAQGLLVESLFNMPYGVKMDKTGKKSLWNRIFKRKTVTKS